MGKTNLQVERIVGELPAMRARAAEQLQRATHELARLAPAPSPDTTHEFTSILSRVANVLDAQARAH